MFRLQKIMDECCAGVSAQFMTNKSLVTGGMELLARLKEDAEKLAARDLRELLRCSGNIHWLWIAESPLHHVMFDEGNRCLGYYFHVDFPEMDEKNWLCSMNSVYDPKTGEWTIKKVPIINLPV
jgi:adenylylsulfate reductase, subunit A